MVSYYENDAGVYYDGKKAIDLDFNSTSEFVVREGTTAIGNISSHSTSDESPGILILPESIRSIGNIKAPLTKIEISEKSQVFCSVDGVLFSKDKQVLARYPSCHDGEQYVVPDGVKLIYHDAFHSCRYLKRVVLPDGVSIIDRSAFHSCKNLTNVVLPDTVITIREAAFSHAPLEEVEMAARPITIEELAFTPNLYSRHGKETFANTIIYFRYNDLRIPLVLVDNWGLNKDEKILSDFIATDDVGKKQLLYYDVKKSEYKVFMAFYLAIVHEDEDCIQYIKKSKTRWSADKIKLYADLIDYVLDKEKETKKTKLSDNKKKKDPPLSKWSFVELPDGSWKIDKYKGKDTVIEVPDMFRGMPVKLIGEEAFSGDRRAACKKIEKIIIPESINEIEARAFEFCELLTEITLPDEMETINRGVFSGCSNLAKVSLPKSLKRIGDNAFSGCNNLQEIIIPDSVDEIGMSAFRECTQLKEFRFPPKITKIKSVLERCSELTMISIGNAVVSIGYYSFVGCDKLESVEVRDDNETKIYSWEEFCEKMNIFSGRG